jgi:hypothetical protein
VISLLPTKAGTREITTKVSAAGVTDPVDTNNGAKLALTVRPRTPVKK